MNTQPKIRILGVDPGSHVAGFGCIDVKVSKYIMPQHVRIVDAGVLRFRRERPHCERIGELFNSIVTLADKLDPEYCVIEKAFHGVNPSSALKLGEARGALIAASRSRGMIYSELTPATVKKTIAGRGQATKDEVDAALKRLIGFDRGKLPFDVSDALAIALSFCLLQMPTNSADRLGQKAASKRQPSID